MAHFNSTFSWLSELFVYPATIPVDKDLDMIILLLTLLLLGCVSKKKNPDAEQRYGLQQYLQ